MPRPRATIFQRQAQHTVVSTARPAAAASARPSTVRTPSRNGPGAQAPDEDGERRGGAREAGPRPRGPAHRRRPICSRQDQQVGVVDGDGELVRPLPAPGAGARRRRSRRPARPPARTRRRPTRRTTPPPGRPRRRRGARGSAGRAPRRPSRRTPRRRPRRRPGRAGGPASSRGAGGRRTRRPRGRPADPPGVSSTRPTTDSVSSTGQPAPAQAATSPASSSPVSRSSSAEAVIEGRAGEVAGAQPGDVGLPRLDGDRGPVGGRARQVGGGDLQQVGVAVVHDPVLRPGQPRREPAAHRAGAAAEVVDHPAAGRREVSREALDELGARGPRRRRARAGRASPG